MKKIISVLLMICILMVLTGCACKHEWKDATCTEPKTCGKCGATEGEALGHNWIEVTCTEPKTCATCGATEGIALGHDWKEATCTEPKTCVTCGETSGTTKEHTVLNYEVVIEATCTTEGIETGLCEICGQEQKRVIEAIGHNYLESANVATSCRAIGYIENTCEHCGDVQRTEFEMIDHVFSEWKTTKAPTCKAVGYEERVCEGCGMKEKNELVMIDHVFSEWKTAKAPTCKAVGYEERVCSGCGMKEKNELVKIDHNFSEWKVSTAATDTKAGTEVRTCSMCKTKETQSYELSEAEKRAYRASKGIAAGNTESNKVAEVTVKSVSFKKKIGSSSYFSATSQYGTFFILSISYKNLDNVADYISYNDFVLVLNGAKYEPSWDCCFYGSGFLINENVNPNCTLNTKIGFDIPEDIAKSGELKLKVSSGGFFDGFVTVEIY